MSNKIRLRIHHRGKLVETPVKWYVNGEVTKMNQSWDVDYISYMELEDMIKSEGYVKYKMLMVLASQIQFFSWSQILE